MLVVVGGHARDIGKTSVAAGLIRALPEANWTAMKITQLGHGFAAPEQGYAMDRERQPGPGDTGRFLAAGAREAYWVRTAEGGLASAMPAIRKVYAASENLIVESNSIVEFLTPGLYLVVLDFAQPDFKASSRRFLERADACVVIERGVREPAWEGVARAVWERLPRFVARPPVYVTAELAAFVGGAAKAEMNPGPAQA